MPFYERKIEIPVVYLNALRVGSLNRLSSLWFERRIVMARSRKLESGFQDKLRRELKKLFPGCMIFKMDQIQGIPDILILFKDKWASLECKKSGKASHRPNQEYYVDLMNKMSFSRFIFPENKDEVLEELKKIFK